jgi:hypothetical protein
LAALRAGALGAGAGFAGAFAAGAFFAGAFSAFAGFVAGLAAFEAVRVTAFSAAFPDAFPDAFGAGFAGAFLLGFFVAMVHVEKASPAGASSAVVTNPPGPAPIGGDARTRAGLLTCVRGPWNA